VIQIKKTMEL